MEKSRSKIGFNYSALALLIFILLFIVHFIVNLTSKNKSDFYFMVVGVIAFISFLLGVVGFINSILGLREKNSTKKIIGLILSGIIAVIFTFIFIDFFNNI